MDRGTGEKSGRVHPICRNQMTAVTDRKGEQTHNLTVYGTAERPIGNPGNQKLGKLEEPVGRRPAPEGRGGVKWTRRGLIGHR